MARQNKTMTADKYPCSCGCSGMFDAGRMQTVTVKGGQFLVAKRHRNRITDEVIVAAELNYLVHWLSDKPIIERWRHAARVFEMQLQARAELETRESAYQHACFSWWLLVLPKPVSFLWLKTKHLLSRLSPSR